MTEKVSRNSAKHMYMQINFSEDGTSKRTCISLHDTSQQQTTIVGVANTRQPSSCHRCIVHEFPLVPDLLSQLNGKFLHQNLQMLSLHAWTLSSNQFEIDSFQRKLQIMSLRQEDLLLGRSTMQMGCLFQLVLTREDYNCLGLFIKHSRFLSLLVCAKSVG